MIQGQEVVPTACSGLLPGLMQLGVVRSPVYPVHSECFWFGFGVSQAGCHGTGYSGLAGDLTELDFDGL